MINVRPEQETSQEGRKVQPKSQFKNALPSIGMDSRFKLHGVGGREKKHGVTANRYRVWGLKSDKNVLKLILVMVTRNCEYT